MKYDQNYRVLLVILPNFARCPSCEGIWPVKSFALRSRKAEHVKQSNSYMRVSVDMIRRQRT